AFSGEGLTSEQKDMQLYLKKVLNFRKNSKAIHEGKTVHFAPIDGTYFLFRIKDDEIVVHIINKNDKPITIDLNRFKEIGLKGTTLKNLLTGENFIWNHTIQLSEKGSVIFATKL
ncbi:MAG: cyclomaltodextrinase C-terminal domain-containing protein, partial [Polaribacter sp.]|nr:cyclomaltodextrinase C-terminal domain-containing protein [Polaribacter sp.]